METVLYPQLFCPGGGGERATVSWNARVILRSVFVERAKNCSFREYYTDFKSAVHKKKKIICIRNFRYTDISVHIIFDDQIKFLCYSRTPSNVVCIDYFFCFIVHGLTPDLLPKNFSFFNVLITCRIPATCRLIPTINDVYKSLRTTRRVIYRLDGVHERKFHRGWTLTCLKSESYVDLNPVFYCVIFFFKLTFNLMSYFIIIFYYWTLCVHFKLTIDCNVWIK